MKNRLKKNPSLAWTLMMTLSLNVGVQAHGAERNGEQSKAQVLAAQADAADAAEAELKAELAKISDIRDLEILRPGLKPGTIAIAFPDQLHPTQAQTGHQELEEFKIPFFKDLMNKNPKNFSKQLFQAVLDHTSVSPVYLHAPLKGDSREGSMPVLGWITDRTHGSDAQAQVYEKAFGEKGLRKLLYDKQGRPLNFILVQVMDDVSNLNESEFIDFMQTNRHCYLKTFRRKKNGDTEIKKISFRDLPQDVTKTGNNPFRGLVGVIQHLDPKSLGRSSTDFSQFIDAQALVKHKVVKWDDISATASKKTYEKARRKAIRFFKSRNAENLPGADPTKNKKSADDSGQQGSSTRTCQDLMSGF